MNADLSVSFQGAEHGCEYGYYGLVECDIV